jgi:hypothetical protein
MNGSQRESVRLGTSRRLSLYAVGIGVWLTGGLWLLFHHFVVTQGEFGPQANPLEAWWLKLHGAFGFAAIWFFGLLWGAHVSRAWPLLRRRWSGGLMTALFLWLTISGYLLYYVGNDTARAILSILHWVIGLGCPLAFVWHRFSFRWLRQRNVESYNCPEREAGVGDELAAARTLEQFSVCKQQPGGNEVSD